MIKSVVYDDDQVKIKPASRLALLSCENEKYKRLYSVSGFIAKQNVEQKRDSMKRLNLSEFKSNKICNKHVSLIASCV